jgi:hypothetical protein
MSRVTIVATASDAVAVPSSPSTAIERPAREHVAIVASVADCDCSLRAAFCYVFGLRHRLLGRRQNTDAQIEPAKRIADSAEGIRGDHVDRHHTGQVDETIPHAGHQVAVTGECPVVVANDVLELERRGSGNIDMDHPRILPGPVYSSPPIVPNSTAVLT